MELHLSKYFFIRFYFLPSFLFLSYSRFLLLICLQIEGCKKTAKYHVSNQRVMWQQVACVCPLHISIFYWNRFFCVSFFLSASLVSIFQIAFLPTQHSWPTSNLNHLSNLSIYSQQLGAWKDLEPHKNQNEAFNS